MRAGGKPNIINNIEKPDSIDELITFGNVIRGKYEWYYPFFTNDIGITFMVIESTELVPYDLAKEGIDAHYFALPVYWNIYQTVHVIINKRILIV